MQRPNFSQSSLVTLPKLLSFCNSSSVMESNPPLLFLILLSLLLTSSSSTLDPKQFTALQSLNIPTYRDPCTQPSLHNATHCDWAKPFRHLISLHLINCSPDTEMSTKTLKDLSTLQDLQFINCPITPVYFPSQLIANLHSFTCINSLNNLTGTWLSRLWSLTDLTVSNVSLEGTQPLSILWNMKKLRSVTISQTNLTGSLPKTWNINTTHVDLSGNMIQGYVPNSLTLLGKLESLNLSSNALVGSLPGTFGNLVSLKVVSFASNSMSGSLPDSLSEISGLVHLDLSSNKFNGSIPKYISNMRSLRYLNLENNEFKGVLPFNSSFIRRLTVFKVGGNSGLCYNVFTVSSKWKLGIAPCNSSGLPAPPPPEPEGSTRDDEEETQDGDHASNITQKDDKKHGKNKVGLGVGIGVSSLVFLIVFFVFLYKRYRRPQPFYTV